MDQHFHAGNLPLGGIDRPAAALSDSVRRAAPQLVGVTATIASECVDHLGPFVQLDQSIT